MGYVLTEEQQFLKDAAKDLFKSAPVATVRELRDKEDELGYASSLWEAMIEMGWPGIAVKEENGGLNFGYRGFGILMEESGRSLSASPILSVVLSSIIIEKYGTQEQVKALESICAEGTVVSLAIQEGDFFKPNQPGLKADNKEGHFILNGTKEVVMDAHVANQFLVTAATEKGITVFLIDSATEGLTIEKEFLMDSRFYSKLSFENVNVSSAQIVGEIDKGSKIIDTIVNSANALLSAELVGIMSEAFERTIEYLKERRQFDKAIGSFQGLQHRAADLYGEIEIAKSLTIKALDALDENNFMAPAFCSMAKVKCIKVAQLSTNEGIQMFGGIGMTDDEEIGFFLKRARVVAQLFGGLSYHLDRFAKMSGY